MQKVRLGDICKIFSAGDKPNIFSDKLTELCSIPVYGNGQDNKGLVGYTNNPIVLEEAINNISTRFWLWYSVLSWKTIYTYSKIVISYPK